MVIDVINKVSLAVNPIFLIKSRVKTTQNINTPPTVQKNVFVRLATEIVSVPDIHLTISSMIRNHVTAKQLPFRNHIKKVLTSFCVFINISLYFLIYFAQKSLYFRHFMQLVEKLQQ